MSANQPRIGLANLGNYLKTTHKYTGRDETYISIAEIRKSCMPYLRVVAVPSGMVWSSCTSHNIP